MRQPIRHTHPSVSLRSPSACVSATLATATLAATFAATLSLLTVSPAAASPALPALDATGSPGAGRAAVTLSPGAAAASPGASHAATTASAAAAAGTSPILEPGPVLMPPIRYVALGDSFAALSDLLPTATLPQKPALARASPPSGRGCSALTAPATTRASPPSSWGRNCGMCPAAAPLPTISGIPNTRVCRRSGTAFAPIRSW